jgi:hypothetical protein
VLLGKDTGLPHLLAPNLLTGGKRADLVIRGDVVLNRTNLQYQLYTWPEGQRSSLNQDCTCPRANCNQRPIRNSQDGRRRARPPGSALEQTQPLLSTLVASCIGQFQPILTPGGSLPHLTPTCVGDETSAIGSLDEHFFF